jgi:hypothetical protein
MGAVPSILKDVAPDQSVRMARDLVDQTAKHLTRSRQRSSRAANAAVLARELLVSKEAAAGPLRKALEAKRASYEATLQTAQRLGWEHKEPQRSLLAAMREEIRRDESTIDTAIPGLLEARNASTQTENALRAASTKCSEALVYHAVTLLVACQPLSETAHAHRVARTALLRELDDPLVAARRRLRIRVQTRGRASVNDSNDARRPPAPPSTTRPVKTVPATTIRTTGSPVSQQSTSHSTNRSTTSRQSDISHQLNRSSTARPTAFGRKLLSALGQTTRQLGWDGHEPLATYLIRIGFETIDLRPKGGCLWVVASRTKFEELAAQFSSNGVVFQYAREGGSATKHRSAWWTRSRKR